MGFVVSLDANEVGAKGTSLLSPPKGDTTSSEKAVVMLIGDFAGGATAAEDAVVVELVELVVVVVVIVFSLVEIGRSSGVTGGEALHRDTVTGVATSIADDGGEEESFPPNEDVEDGGDVVCKV